MTTITSGPCTISIVNPPSSLLGQAAALLSSQQWLNMSTGYKYNNAGTQIGSYGSTYAPSGTSAFIQTQYNTGIALGYSTKIMFDPGPSQGNGLMYVFGGDHNTSIQTMQFYYYTESTNTWASYGVPSWVNPPGNHEWEHACLSPGSPKVLWFRPYSQLNMLKWAGAGNPTSWTTYSMSPYPSYADPEMGIEYFPALSRIIVIDCDNGDYGYATGWDPVNNVINPSTPYSTNMLGLGHTSKFCQYNPTSNLLWMGGSSATFLMDHTGTVTQADSSPTVGTTVPMTGIGNTNNCAVAVPNPTNGNWLVFWDNNNVFDFNPSSSLGSQFTTRTNSGNNAGPFVPGGGGAYGPPFGVAAVSVAEYGVVAFVQTFNQIAADMWLYKP